jgi:hypothetical protein
MVRLDGEVGLSSAREPTTDSLLFHSARCVISCLFLSPINHGSVQWFVESIQTFADRTIVRPSVPRGFTGGMN